MTTTQQISDDHYANMTEAEYEQRIAEQMRLDEEQARTGLPNVPQPFAAKSVLTDKEKIAAWFKAEGITDKYAIKSCLAAFCRKHGKEVDSATNPAEVEMFVVQRWNYFPFFAGTFLNQNEYKKP